MGARSGRPHSFPVRVSSSSLETVSASSKNISKKSPTRYMRMQSLFASFVFTYSCIIGDNAIDSTFLFSEIIKAFAFREPHRDHFPDQGRITAEMNHQVL